MTNTQIVGVAALVAGVGMYLQRTQAVNAAKASTDLGTGSGASLWPDLPSVLGTIGDRFNYFLTGKQAGNSPIVPVTPASEPLDVQAWTPGQLDDYLPQEPLNPQYGEPGDTVPQGGDPNLEPWNDSAYAELAWFFPPGADFAPAPPGVADYLSPGA